MSRLVSTHKYETTQYTKYEGEKRRSAGTACIRHMVSVRLTGVLLATIQLSVKQLSTIFVGF